MDTCLVTVLVVVVKVLKHDLHGNFILTKECVELFVAEIKIFIFGDDFAIMQL